MTQQTITTKPRQYRRSSWVIGVLVLAGLAWSVWSLLTSERGRVETPRADIGEVLGGSQDPGSTPAQPERPRLPILRTLRGIVRTPFGEPAAGAEVRVMQATTAAPEWRNELLEEAYTYADGRFTFELSEEHDLLIEYRHPDYAGDFFAVPRLRDELELQLAEGFPIGGIVTDVEGEPVANARVAIESSLDGQRRPQVRVTTTRGGYSFEGLPAGLVRLVARHPRWQPVSRSVLIGETVDTVLKFNTFAAAALRGRVVTTRQVPVVGADLVLLPANGRLGLVDPVRATSGPNGEFALEGLARGTMLLLARHPEHGTLRRTVTARATPAETVLEMPGRSRVSGRLVGAPPADGQPALDVGGVTLRFVETGGEIQRVTTAADGTFAFERPVSPGRATIAALDRGVSFMRSESFEQAVQIEESPRTELELTVVQPTRVRGRCVDSEGQPLAGVAVFGSNASRLIGSDLAALIGAVGQDLTLALTVEQKELLAITGADGTFEFTGQAPGPLALRYELSDYAVRNLRFIVPAAADAAANGDIGDVVMSRGCSVEGVVRQGDQPLAGATVSVLGAQAQRTVTTVDGGRFVVNDLMPGEYRVRARLPSMPAGQDEVAVTLALGEDPPELELELPAGRSVTGTVKNQDGQPVVGAIVIVDDAVGQPARTDQAGAFALDLPSDRDVTLTITTFDNSHSTTIEVPRTDRAVSVQLDAPPTCRLVARVSGLPGRTRLSSVLMQIKPRGSNTERNSRTRLVDIQNGVLDWPLCPVGPCRVEIRCEGYVPFIQDIDFSPSVDTDLGDIVLERGAFVLGRVVDDKGAPVANARVFVGNEGDLQVYEPRTTTAEDGTFRILGVSTRSATVVAWAAGYSPAVRTLTLPNDVISGRTIEIPLELGSTIEVSVPDAQPGSIVQLLREGRLVASAALDEAGVAQFVDRATGLYRVRLYGTGKPQELRVEQPGSTVEFALEYDTEER